MWMSRPSNLKTVVNLAPQRRWALAAMDSNTGWASVGELEITRRISLVAVCCSNESARAFSSRRSPASCLRSAVSRLSNFSSASTLASSAAFVTCVMDTLLPQGAGPGAVSSRQRPHLRLRLLHPVRHLHLVVHRRRGGEMLTRVIPLVCPPVELAEADVAVGKERAHPELLGERQGCTVVALRVSTVEGTGMSGDLAEEVEGPGFVAALPALSCKAEGPAGKGDRVVESVREQARLAHLRDDRCLEGLKGFLAFLQQGKTLGQTTRQRVDGPQEPCGDR